MKKLKKSDKTKGLKFSIRNGKTVDQYGRIFITDKNGKPIQPSGNVQ